MSLIPSKLVIVLFVSVASAKCSLNNLIDSDHASMKRIITIGKGFKTLASAKKTLRGIEIFRMIKIGHCAHINPGVHGEMQFYFSLYGLKWHPDLVYLTDC